MKTIIRKLIFLIIAIFAIYKIYDYYKPDKTSKVVNEIRESVEKESTENTSNQIDSEYPESKDSVSKNKISFSSQLVKKALEVNADTIAWIRVPGTGIDYPVLKSKENDYYLHRNIYGEYDEDGSIYLNNYSDTNDANLVIYGHNMQNGNMFSTLTKYLNKDFLTVNDRIVFETIDELRNYEIIAVASVDYTDGTEPLLFSDYTEDTKAYFKALEPYMIWKNMDEYSEDSNYISLVTCTFETDDTRTVLIGRELNEN